jgi:imidazolonepropionase-like amidohydrolase
LTNVTVIDVESGAKRANARIVLEGDRITALTFGAAADERDVRVLDLHGKYVIPGLWDMHVHFAERSAAKLFVANGVTGVRVMWGNPRWAPGMERFHFAMRDAFEKKEVIGPRMVIASQILDGPKPFWPHSVALSSAEEGRKAVDDAKASGVDFIKVYSLLPRSVYFAIADESKKQGLPFEGHVPESVTVAEASDAGQKSMEHSMGMILACSSHETELRRKRAEFAKEEHGQAEWSKLRRDQNEEAMATYDAGRADALFAKLVTNGTWQCPTLTVEHAMSTFDDPASANDPRMPYVSERTKKMWNPKTDRRTKNRTPEDYASVRAQFEKHLALVGAMNKAGVPILAGTDEVNPYCFAGFGLHDELGWLVKAGLSPLEALRAATLGPARFLGREATIGTVAEGKLADLVVLEEDPLVDIANTRKIAAVVARGVVYERGALEQLLEEAKADAAGSH